MISCRCRRARAVSERAGVVARHVQLQALGAQAGVDRDGALGGVALGAVGLKRPRHAME